jgi:hypothetical protein
MPQDMIKLQHPLAKGGVIVRQPQLRRHGPRDFRVEAVFQPMHDLIDQLGIRPPCKPSPSIDLDQTVFGGRCLAEIAEPHLGTVSGFLPSLGECDSIDRPKCSTKNMASVL